MTDSKKENLIHIKLEYDEARLGKIDLLSSQLNLLNMLKKIKSYKELRQRELLLKQNLQKKAKETKDNLIILERNLPKIKIPKILKEKNDYSQIKEKTKKIYSRKIDSIEQELLEIKGKLNHLEN